MPVSEDCPIHQQVTSKSVVTHHTGESRTVTQYTSESTVVTVTLRVTQLSLPNPPINQKLIINQELVNKS